ncbi:hypothetical protein LTR94_026896, partial [Friedmanniomyces endolithicus]
MEAGMSRRSILAGAAAGFAAAGLGVASPAFAQASAKPRLLANVRIFDGASARLIEGRNVLIVGDMIQALVPAGEIVADADVVDCGGRILMPGMIDAHWHGSMGSDEIIPQQSWVNYAALAFGVTTLHDPSNDNSEIFAHSELAKAGRVVAPRIFSTGTILYGAATPTTAVVNNLDDARSHLRRMQAIGAWSVKSYNQPRRDQRQQIMQAARELGMMVVPEGGSLYHANMSMLVDGHTTIEHSVPVERMYDDAVQLWSQTGTAYTPTLIVGFGGAWGENHWYETTDVWKDPILTQYVPRRILDARSRRPVKTPPEELNHISIARESKRLMDQGVSVQIG